MADVWIFDQIDTWGSGPLVYERTYCRFRQVFTIGISSGDGLRMLGMEEQYRRTRSTLRVFLEGPRVHLTFDIALVEGFYLYSAIPTCLV